MNKKHRKLYWLLIIPLLLTLFFLRLDSPSQISNQSLGRITVLVVVYVSVMRYFYKVLNGYQICYTSSIKLLLFLIVIGCISLTLGLIIPEGNKQFFLSLGFGALSVACICFLPCIILSLRKKE